MQISQFAQRVGVSAGLLRQMERAGRIPKAPRRHGRRIYFVEQVETFRNLILDEPAKSEAMAKGSA